MFTLLEILSYPTFYDSDHKKFVDLVSDNRIVFATYVQLARDIARIGAYADMMHMYALSAVLRLPIRSYYPPQINPEFASEPYSRKFCGRGVNLSESLLEDIFGQDGLINADAISVDVKCEEIEAKSMEVSSKFHTYFSGRLKQNIQEQWGTESPPGYLDKRWTNNNSESLNHALKRAIDWKSQPLLELVNIVKNLVDTQYKELLRSLVSMGQGRLSETHRQFHVSKSGCLSKNQERQRLFKRLRRFVPKDKKTDINGRNNDCAEA